MKSFCNYIPTRLYFGAGALNELGKIALPGQKALIVITSGKSVRASGTLDRMQTLLRQNGVASVVYDRIQANPTKDQVMAGATMARRENCDFVLGLGGGSPIDSAKSIAVMAVNDGDYWDYVHGGTGKGMAVKHRPLPVVAVTTTAGTGTEIDPWTVVTHNEEKIGFGYDLTFPVIAIVDPELMLTVPPNLTAFQGFDAFFHAAECFLANIATPVSELYSLKSIELLCRSLPLAVKDGQNLEARSDVALANTLSGMAESTSCNTSEHSLAHAIGGMFPEVPHGAALIMVSKAWFAFYEPKLPAEFSRLAAASGKTSFSQALAQLQTMCGVADLNMSDYGIRPGDLAAVNRNAWETMGGLFKLDRLMLTPAQSLQILEESYR